MCDLQGCAPPWRRETPAPQIQGPGPHARLPRSLASAGTPVPWSLLPWLCPHQHHLQGAPTHPLHQAAPPHSPCRKRHWGELGSPPVPPATVRTAHSPSDSGLGPCVGLHPLYRGNTREVAHCGQPHLGHRARAEPPERVPRPLLTGKTRLCRGPEWGSRLQSRTYTGEADLWA